MLYAVYTAVGLLKLFLKIRYLFVTCLKWNILFSHIAVVSFSFFFQNYFARTSVCRFRHIKVIFLYFLKNVWLRLIQNFLKIKQWHTSTFKVANIFPTRFFFLYPFSFYTVKKVDDFTVSQPGCHWPNSPWKRIIKIFPAGDGKMAILFYSVPYIIDTANRPFGKTNV